MKRSEPEDAIRHFRTVSTQLKCSMFPPGLVTDRIYSNRGKNNAKELICTLLVFAICFEGRGLNSGLCAAVALVNALQRRNLDSFEHYMQELREREMQGRSQSMLRHDASLPELIDAMRTEEAVQKTVQEMNVDQEYATFVENVKLWRDCMERRTHWPHEHLSDAIIEKKLQTGRTKPREATIRVLNASGVLMDDGRRGWPVACQGGRDVLPPSEATVTSQNARGIY